MGGNISLWVYKPRPFCRLFCLWLTYILAVGHKLAVKIGGGDGVMVEKVDISDTASNKSLKSRRADTADTENGNASVFQFFHGILAEQSLGSFIKLPHFTFTFLQISLSTHSSQNARLAVQTALP